MLKCAEPYHFTPSDSSRACEGLLVDPDSFETEVFMVTALDAAASVYLSRAVQKRLARK